MITEQETELQARIDAIQKACKEAHEELERLLQPLREPIGAYARELKELQAVRFTQETGLIAGDELAVTPEFEQFQIRNGNGRWWNKSEPLTVADSTVLYAHYGELSVAQGASHVGGVPLPMVLRMRQLWLQKHLVGKL